MSAQTAGDPPVQGGSSVPAATSDDTGELNKGVVVTTTPSSATTPDTPRSTESGADAGSSVEASGSPTSKPFAPPSTHWTKPRTVKGFAAQVNDVATRLLNGEIDLETARAYGQLARTVAQATSIEVTRARFLQQEPSMSLDDGDE